MALGYRLPLGPFLPAPGKGGGVLLVRDDIIGDLIYNTSAAVHWLSQNGYEAYIVIRKEFISVGKLFLPKERLYPLDAKLYRKSLKYRINFLKELRAKGFDVAIGSTIPSSINSDILRYCGARERWSYRRKDSLSERHRLRGTKQVPTLPLMKDDIYRSVLEHEEALLSAAMGKIVHSLTPCLSLPSDKTDLPKPYIHYIPEAGNMKRAFLAERLLPILKELAKGCGAHLVVTGLAETDYGADCINLSGKTSLEDVFKIVANAACVVGNESGLVHMGWIAGRPTVMFLGGGHYGRFMPDGKALTLNTALSCFCCDWKCKYNEEPFPCVNVDDATLERLKEYIVTRI